ncbi:unnamed protein product [Porites evermanni]|uniref:Phosphatidylinositol transfer protein N-terminal domain-containing protein n=1 Tax=Porites evermanni TaxID=104178 RepID=A0ABN8LDJ6_9CNID|nr:unnamed protein product [Porites evermanni]
MILKEYRICMPMTVEEYHIGQLFMISKHSHEQSEQGEGVHVVKNEPQEDETHGLGQYTEKRVYLSSRLPAWIRSYIPKLFYIEEKAWNFYPYTETEYCCSFLPRFSIKIRTKYFNDNGSSQNCFDLNEEMLESREVVNVDIAYDELPEKHYTPEEDCRYFKSKKTGRGPLKEGWRDDSQPIMCSYKLVTVRFDVWGLASRVESFVHNVIRDILLLGHRQAFAWIDDWIDMGIDDVREYEKDMQEKTNNKVGADM